jgi:hypothetical protein
MTMGSHRLCSLSAALGRDDLLFGCLWGDPREPSNCRRAAIGQMLGSPCTFRFGIGQFLKKSVNDGQCLWLRQHYRTRLCYGSRLMLVVTAFRRAPSEGCVSTWHLVAIGPVPGCCLSPEFLMPLGLVPNMNCKILLTASFQQIDTRLESRLSCTTQLPF